MFILDDNPSIDDKFGFDREAEILYDVICKIPLLPFTIGIFGEWGCGKTSLMKMIEKKLDENNKDMHKLDAKLKEKLLKEELISDKDENSIIHLHQVISKENLMKALLDNKFDVKTIDKILEYSAFKTKTVWFNPWKYEGKEVIWNALIQQIFYTMKEDPAFKDNEEFKKKLRDTGKNVAKFVAKTFVPRLTHGLINEKNTEDIIT